MKISDLTEKQCMILAKNNPEWMVKFKPEWLAAYILRGWQSTGQGGWRKIIPKTKTCHPKSKPC